MSRRNPAIRAAQLDLARQMESPEFLREFVRFLRDHGYNTLVLYLEGRVKTASFPYRPDAESYAPEVMTELVEYAGALGINIIPVVSAFGHAEMFLATPELAGLSENRGGVPGRFGGTAHVDFCPSLPETRRFLEAYLSEIAALFPSAYFHAGFDEVWDIGYCEKCRARLAGGESQADLFAGQLRVAHEIVTDRLGKRMIVWDDMFEIYPEALATLPRDVILACWQYQTDVRRTRGHFSNRRTTDGLAHYETLGFEYLVCPTDYTLANLDSFTDYGLTRRPLGTLLTTWAKGDIFMRQSLPLVAHFGRRWSGTETDTAAVFRGVVRDLFGLDDEVFLRALRVVYESGMLVEAHGRPDHYLVRRANDVSDSRPAAAELLLTLLPAYLDRVSPGGRAILREILLSLDLAATGYALGEWVPDWLDNHGPAEGRDRRLAEFGQLLERRLRNAEARWALWAEERPGVDPEPAHQRELQAVAALRGLPEKKENHGLLTVRFMQADLYSAERTRIHIRYAGGAWEKAAEGVFKEPWSADCVYTMRFFVSRERVPEAVRLESLGFGGQGFCYLSIENDAGRFVPDQIRECAGTVSDPDALLAPDWRWTWVGVKDVAEAVRRPELAESVHRIDISLRRESLGVLP